MSNIWNEFTRVVTEFSAFVRKEFSKKVDDNDQVYVLDKNGKARCPDTGKFKKVDVYNK